MFMNDNGEKHNTCISLTNLLTQRQ